MGALGHHESTNNVRGGGAPRYVLPLDAKPSRELCKTIEYHYNTWS